MAANVDGTRNLMIAAGDAGVTRIVYTSSVAVLGLKPFSLHRFERFTHAVAGSTILACGLGMVFLGL